ncbi:hypothetical protein LCGC14_2705200, partial [marine sediment metagenome]
DLNDLLSAIPMGLAISEIVWENDRFGLPKGDSGLGEVRDWYVPVGIESRDPRMFEFDKDGDMLFIPFDNPNGEATHRDKYIIFRPYTWYQDPYGYPRLRSIWWFTWFKRLIEKYYMSFLERFGSPIPKARTRTCWNWLRVSSTGSAAQRWRAWSMPTAPQATLAWPGIWSA